MENVRVRREPLTYEKHAPASYYRDLALRARDSDAAARLDRHTREMDVIAAELDERSARGLARDGVETRLAPSRSSTFAVPLWLNEAFATAPRPGRVLAALSPNFDLPSGISVISIPRLTSGTSERPTADNAPATSQDFADAATTSKVVTIDGESDVALQLLEQSPAGAHTDWAVTQDLISSYDAHLETQLIFGTGAGATTDSQLVGITNLSGINAITYTDASPTLSEMYPFIGQAAAAIGNNRKLPPEAWLMSTSRWAWIGSSEDNQLRPIVPPDVHAPVASLDGKVPAVSSMLGWPVYCDDAVLLEGNANPGEIIACRPSDLMVFEGQPRNMVFEEVLSGTLQARIVYRNYVAAIVGRWPSGIAVLTGTGILTQSGF